MQASLLEGKTSGKSFILLLIFLLTVLCVLFHESFDPKEVLFANDLPLGAAKAEQNRLPARFTGNWLDSNWIGAEGVSAAPDITSLINTILPPVIVLKLYAPLTMLLLGLSAWLCFRELRFHPVVCLLGGLAAGLNMHFFSYACWGLGHWIIAVAMVFLATAALVSKSIKRGWVRGILAGMVVGIGLMEGFDVGAINSLYVGVFGLFAGIVGEKISARAVGKSALTVLVVAIFAAFTAAFTISSLVGTQIKGVVGMAQDEASREKRWFEATQWSLPKKEILRVLIPGIFGYRMDTEGTGVLYEKSYWGWVAQSPDYEKTHQGYARFSGNGEYAGIFVLLVAILAVAQSFRKQNSPLSLTEKKFVWFWLVVAVVSLLLSLGRHAVFYQLIYALPYFSTIRNPNKFMHPFHIALLVLFGYGLESMARGCFDTAKNRLTNAFEKKWMLFSGAAVGFALLGWMIYFSAKRDVLNYLQKEFPAEIASKILEFSFGEVAWFVFFLALSVVLVSMILRGKFAGRLKLAAIFMALLITGDLCHADLPWIVYQNYKQKYQTNAVLEILRDKPYEHRVAGMLPFRNETLAGFQQFYFVEWLQHHFYYYGIQTLDMPQNPRPAADNTAYQNNFYNAGATGLTRMWQLANVRYIFGLTGGFVDAINKQLDPGKNRFHLHTAFSISKESQDGPYIVQTNSTGPFALIEFDGALPRAKLYSDWQVVTNDQATLEKLAEPQFDPFKTVLVTNEIPAPATNATNANPGTVEITDYHPKRVELTAKVETPSILLLNDKYNPDWNVFVDGKQKPLLRANFIMRAVQLDKGEHKIEFRFQPPLTMLYVSLAALAIGLGTLAFVAFGRRQSSVPATQG